MKPKQKQSGSYQSGTVESFTYDLQNRLTGYQSSSTTASYSYGANGLRKRKSVGGKTTGFVWDRGNVAAEMTGSTITNMYNYGPDGITEREKSNGEISIYLKNAHGDVTGISDEYGIPEERYQFDAFGNTQTETEPAPFGYCGEYRDAESGLIYLRNRYYDPETGWFITEDPVKDGTNWYVYAANNPVMFIDPWGLAVTDWDRDHCSKEDIKRLEQNTEKWENGSAAEKAEAEADSKEIRQKYISNNEVQLDNGYMVSTFSKTVQAGVLKGNATGMVTIEFSRIYGENYTYVVLNKSIIETTVNGRIQTSKIDVMSGCICETGNQIYQKTTYNSNYVEITYDWDPVIDDRGAGYTTVGTTADFSFVRGNSNDSTKITIVNNVYDEYVRDENGIRDSDIDSMDVLMEILPRGER